MAITITQNPETTTPSDNPVTWVFESDETTQNNFYFIIEVQIASPSVFSVVERHKIFPEVGNVAHFDASSITERYCSMSNPNLVKCKITIKENWDNAVSPASLDSGEVDLFKARLRKRDFVNYQSIDYSLLTTSGVKFLTFEPRGTTKVKQNDLKYLNFINSLSVPCSAIYSTYTSAGVAIDTKNETLASDYWQSISVGVDRLETDLLLDFTGASYYEIEFHNGASGGEMELFTIYLDESCQYSTSTRLHFMNTLGGIDSYTFGLLAREKFEVQSFGYERQFGNFNASNQFVYDLKDGTVVDFLKTSKKTMELTSDWMSESVQNWLSKELYMSPIVWIEEGGELYRCKVTNTSFDKKIQETDMVFQEVVQIELESNLSANV